MTIYRVERADLLDWRAFAGCFTVVTFETGDRRVARRVVRLARKLGYRVRFEAIA